MWLCLLDNSTDWESETALGHFLLNQLWRTQPRFTGEELKPQKNKDAARYPVVSIRGDR